MRNRDNRFRRLPAVVCFLTALVAGIVAPRAAVADGTKEDCITATCSGPKSCAKLKKGCNFISGTYTEVKREGKVVGGKCKACFGTT